MKRQMDLLSCKQGDMEEKLIKCWRDHLKNFGREVENKF